MGAPKRQQAPGALRLVQAFVNTNDIEGRRDDLSTPQQLQFWLGSQGLLTGEQPVGEAELQRALELREALRELMLANNGGAFDPSAIAALNRGAEQAPLLIKFAGDGQAQLWPGGSGVDGALGRLLAVVFAAMLDGTWRRLKVCRNNTCRWAFYDGSRNQGSTWCSMAICGSRVKARAYRQRHQATKDPRAA